MCETSADTPTLVIIKFQVTEAPCQTDLIHHLGNTPECSKKDSVGYISVNMYTVSLGLYIVSLPDSAICLCSTPVCINHVMYMCVIKHFYSLGRMTLAAKTMITLSYTMMGHPHGSYKYCIVHTTAQM